MVEQAPAAVEPLPDVKEEEKEGQDYTPWKSWTMAELCSWSLLFPISRNSLSALLQIVSDARFKPSDVTCMTAQGLIAHRVAALPVLPLKTVELEITCHQRVMEKDKGTELGWVIKPVKVQIPIVSIVDSVVRFFSDPVRCQLMLTKLQPINHNETLQSSLVP